MYIMNMSVAIANVISKLELLKIEINAAREDLKEIIAQLEAFSKNMDAFVKGFEELDLS